MTDKERIEELEKQVNFWKTNYDHVRVIYNKEVAHQKTLAQIKKPYLDKRA